MKMTRRNAGESLELGKISVSFRNRVRMKYLARLRHSDRRHHKPALSVVTEVSEVSPRKAW